MKYLYPHRKIHIDVDPNAVPKHSRPYPDQRIHLNTFKKELDHLVSIGVLAHQGESEWASSSFITPKKEMAEYAGLATYVSLTK